MANTACHGGCSAFVETNADTFPYCEPCADRDRLMERIALPTDLDPYGLRPVYRPGTLRGLRRR